MFDYEKFDDGNEVNFEENNLTVQPNVTFRDKLKMIMHSKTIHIIVIVLIALDCIFVVLEMLIDIDYIKFEETNVFPEVLHGFSIAILSAFMVEISLKIYVDPKHFFSHKIEILDAIVVLVSWIVDIVLAAVEESEILAILGLLVLLRLVRITNGIVVTAKAKADERVRLVKKKNKVLEGQLEKANNKIESQEEKISNLIKLLQENGVNYEQASSGNFSHA